MRRRTEVEVQLDRALGLDREPRVNPLSLTRRPAHAKRPCEALLAVEPEPASRSVPSREAPAPAAALRDARSRDPPRPRLGAHLPAPQLLDDVAQAQPQHADRDRGALARHFVVDGDLALVGLVDVDLKVLVPPVVPCRVGARARRVLDLDVDDGLGRVLGLLGLWRVRELARLLDRDLQRARERAAQVRLDVLGYACG